MTMNKNWRKLQTPIDYAKLCEAYREINWMWGTRDDRRFPTIKELQELVDDLLAKRYWETGGLGRRDDDDGGTRIMADPKIAKAYETLTHEEANNPTRDPSPPHPVLPPPA